MGNTNLSTTILLLMSTNMYTPIHICILAYTCLLMVITVISYKIMTNTNKYSAIYKRLLSPTKLYMLIHNIRIDVYNFVDDNKGQQHTEIVKGKLIFYNI